MSTISHAWGSRAQIGATHRLLQELQGRPKVAGVPVDGETAPRENAFERSPVAQRLSASASVGLSAKDEVDALAVAVAKAEAAWGQPVIAADVRARMNGGDLYAAQKTIRLLQLGRTPAEVVDGFITAKGSVAGQPIPARDLHFQTFAPIGPPSGKTVVVSPGYLETGRTFDEQVQQLNRAGHTVVVMDHQWAGQSDGRPGGIDRGFGITRDTAAMVAFAAEQAAQTFGPGAEVVVFGNSMGAGPGAFSAALLNDQGLIDLDGPAMPKGVKLVLQAPFFGATPSFTNAILQGAAHLPAVNRISLPALGLPDITDDARAEQLGAQDMVLEDVRSQLSAFKTAQADIDDVMARVARGERPLGAIVIVGNEGDTLADSRQWHALKTALGDQVTLSLGGGTDHVLSQSLGQQGLAVAAVAHLVGR